MTAKIAAQSIALAYQNKAYPGRKVLAVLPDGFGFLTESDTHLHLDLPGTKDWKDICTDLSHEWYLSTVGKIHAGFYNQSVKIASAAFQKIGESEKTLIISGHSEGAAIAAILAEQWQMYVDKLYLFSCPGFADLSYSTCWSRQGIDVESYAGKYDLIPSFPLRARTPLKPKRLKVSAEWWNELEQHSIENLEKAL